MMAAFQQQEPFAGTPFFCLTPMISTVGTRSCGEEVLPPKAA